MAINLEQYGEYKLSKLRTGTFVFSMALCIMTLTAIDYPILTHTDTIVKTIDIWSKIAATGVLIFAGFVWIGFSHLFFINKVKC